MKKQCFFYLRPLALMGILMLLSATPAPAQESSESTSGINSGNYNIRQTIEFGYRDNNITGNQANYDTFVNLGTGVRLFEHDFSMRSLDHNGLLFDNLSLASFGYGGDPNNVTRLRIDKNKWYDFRGVFRRDKNFWGYNLLANPLNPASSNPAVPINFALHGLDLVRRMSDLDLTLLPQSRLTIRLGYSRNVNEGPSFSTAEEPTIIGGVATQTPFFQNWKTTENSYRMGFDFKGLPKTTLSYDQFLVYFKQDTTWQDRNLTFQLSNGTPVDLGAVFDTQGGTPCAAPILNSATKPPTAFEGCDAFRAYNRVARPRTSLPTEQFRFQTSYLKNLDMTGRVSYSSSDNPISGFNELSSGNTSRTLQRGSTLTGPADAKRVSANVDWAATYSVTSKFRIVDSFRYDNFRIPGLWDFLDTAQFAGAPLLPGGLPSMLVSPGIFDAASCPAPFTAATCPQHNSSSGPDLANGRYSRFFGQNLKSNTFELEYDFTNRIGGRLGYRYANRKIADFNSIFFLNETFFPGGPPDPASGFPTSASLAFRGDCAVGSGNVCTVEPDGSVTFSGLTPDSDTERGITKINEHFALMGIWTRPMDSLRISFDLELFSADNSFTRISPRQSQQYRLHVTYHPLTWMNLDGSFDIVENRDNVATVNSLGHNRSVNFVSVLAPDDRIYFDLGYNYLDVFAQALDCWSYGFGPPPPGAIATPCPAGVLAQQSPGDTDPFGGLATYSSTTHYAYGDVMWKPIKRFTTTLGYAGSFVRGNTRFLNPLQPFGPLSYTYQKPYIGFTVEVYKGLAYKMSWGYVGYNLKSVPSPPGLASIGGQDFNGNMLTAAVRYSF